MSQLLSARSFALAVLPLALASCTVAPRPVYRARPIEGTGLWNDGAELVRAEAEDVEVLMAFHAFDRGALVFRVEIANRSERIVTVDPATFHMLGSSTLYAVDPEAALLAADIARSRAIAREESARGTDSLFDFVDLTADFASVSEDRTEEEEQTEALEDQEEELRRLRRVQEHESRLRAIDGSRYRWADLTLRKTSLLPGHTIGGNVRFMPPKEDRAVSIVVPLDTVELRCAFEVDEHGADAASR